MVSFNTHEIPESTVKAIQLAKANNVKVFISTGRPKAFISSLESIEPYIDGYITNNGACSFIGDKVINSNPITPADVDTIYNYAIDHNHPMIIMGKDDFAIINNYDIVYSIFYGELRIRVDRNIKPAEEVMKNEIYQMTMFLDPEEEKQLAAQTRHINSARWCPDFTDITDQSADKGIGLEKMAEYLGFGIGETMSFGDGGNDIPIIKRAGIGVVMGNATDEVKAFADYVTDSVDENGVWNALKHFGVI
ncbi:MAG: Cof-type HAD-IIB family hydrolase [Bacteroidales bacterium]|nr:Cof-type HAD-IIB family hydrolase [Bacteroidales bacterium]